MKKSTGKASSARKRRLERAVIAAAVRWQKFNYDSGAACLLDEALDRLAAARRKR